MSNSISKERTSRVAKPSKNHQIPVPTVDLVVRKGSKLLLEQRGQDPFKGFYCLPGGHVEYGETVEETAIRELKEETSVDAKLIGILGVFSDPKRDPRGHRVTTVFVADWTHGDPLGADDAQSANWVEESELRNSAFDLAFDHTLVLRDYFVWKDSRSQTFWSSRN